MLCFLIGAVILLGVSVLFGIGVGQIIALGNDDDAPANVNRQDWDRVSRRR
jgi:hypothetical protein